MRNARSPRALNLLFVMEINRMRKRARVTKQTRRGRVASLWRVIVVRPLISDGLHGFVAWREIQGRD